MWLNHKVQSDEVDQIVAAWGRERPDLDVGPMQVWSRISRLAQILEAARARAFAHEQLHVWEFDVLAALRRSGPPYLLTPGQLIARTHVTSGTMTNRVDRLVERGLVTRKANPSDGRGVLVGLSDSGRSAVDAALASLVAAETELAVGLDEADRGVLADLLRRLMPESG